MKKRGSNRYSGRYGALLVSWLLLAGGAQAAIFDPLAEQPSAQDRAALGLKQSPADREGETPVALSEAEGYLAKGNCTEALAAAASVLDKNADQVEALSIAVYCASRLKEMDIAAGHLRQLQKSAPDSLALRMAFGHYLYGQGRWAEALLAFQGVLSREPEHPAALYATGLLHERLQQLPAASRAYLRLLEAQPLHVGARLRLADIYLSLDAHARVIETARPLLYERTPGGRPVIDAYALLAEAGFRQNDGAAGKRYLNAGLERAPRHPVLNFIAGLSQLVEERPDAAVQSFRTAVEAGYPGADLALAVADRLRPPGTDDATRVPVPDSNRPLSTWHRQILAHLALAGESEKSREHYQAATAFGQDLRHGATTVAKLLGELPPQALARYDLALLLADRRWFPQASAVLEPIAEAYPRNVPVRLSLGETAEASGDGKGAAAHYAKAGSLAPGLVAPRLKQALLAQRRGDLAAAVGHWQAIRDRVPQWAVPYLHLGGLHQQLGQSAEAIADYRKLIEYLPGFPLGYNQLALLYGGDPATRGQAIELARKAHELNRRDPILADTLGWLLFQDGETDDAHALLTEAAGKRPFDATIQFHLASVEARRDEQEAARSRLERALRFGKDFPERAEAENLLGRLRGDTAGEHEDTVTR